MWRLYISVSFYTQLQRFASKRRTNKNIIPLSGYERLLNTFWPPDVGVKLEIDFDINLDTEDHIPYKHCSVVFKDSKYYVKRVLPAYHILYPLFQPISFGCLTWIDMEKIFQSFSGKSASERWGNRKDGKYVWVKLFYVCLLWYWIKTWIWWYYFHGLFMVTGTTWVSP